MKNIQQFFSLANYYNLFVCNFTKLSVPLTALLAKNTPWHFVKRELCAFKSMKKALCNFLCLLYLGLLFSIECDASGMVIDTILS